MDDEECIVISFSEAKKAFDKKMCQHTRVLVDANLYHIECEQCGEKLDPIGWLIGLKNKGKNVLFEYQQIAKEKEKLTAYIKEHNSCKCEHCGRLTKIYKDGL